MPENTGMPLTNEFDVIDEIKRTLGRPSKKVLLGIGDDAAVAVNPKGKSVFTIDTMVEGVHFDLAYTSPRQLGHKALAVNLSDLAAMGAVPDYALVSLGLKQETSEHFVVELYEGIRGLAKKFGVDIVGGNLVQSPLCTLVDIVAIGGVSKKFFTRSGAKVGDIVAVTGQMGSSAAGLNCFRRLSNDELADHHHSIWHCLEDHLAPIPRVKESLLLQELGGVTAMIDVSDGLSKELHHLATQSKVGFLIQEKSLPITEHTLKAAELLGTQALPWALYGGEDYELLFTVKSSAWSKVESAFKKKKMKVVKLGEVVAKKEGVRIEKPDGSVQRLEPRGWNHFVKRRPPSPLTLS